MDNKIELNDDLLGSVTGGNKEAYESLTYEAMAAFAKATTKEQLDELTAAYMKRAGEMLEKGELSGNEALMMFIPFLSQQYDQRLKEIRGSV